jgi:predicted dienelactone hydrolase
LKTRSRRALFDERKKNRPQDIVLYGHSLGNAPALVYGAAPGKIPF